MTERKGNTYSVSNDVNLLYGMALEVTGDGYNASPEENFVNNCKHQYLKRGYAYLCRRVIFKAMLTYEVSLFEVVERQC